MYAAVDFLPERFTPPWFWHLYDLLIDSNYQNGKLQTHFNWNYIYCIVLQSVYNVDVKEHIILHRRYEFLRNINEPKAPQENLTYLVLDLEALPMNAPDARNTHTYIYQAKVCRY